MYTTGRGAPRSLGWNQLCVRAWNLRRKGGDRVSFLGPVRPAVGSLTAHKSVDDTRPGAGCASALTVFRLGLIRASVPLPGGVRGRDILGWTGCYGGGAAICLNRANNDGFQCRFYTGLWRLLP